MTEIEKLRQLKQQREKMKERQGIALAPKEKEKPAGENTAVTVCPECGSKQLVHDYERAEPVCEMLIECLEIEESEANGLY